MGGDDAVGPRVIEHVVATGLDRGFAAVDLSTDALSLVAYLSDETEGLLVVDAARLGLAPGEFRIFTPDEAETQKELSGLTTHEGDVLRVLEMAASAGFPVPPTPSWASSRATWTAGRLSRSFSPNACRSTRPRPSGTSRGCEDDAP